ncbi:hypothetical protein LINPERPRIM_LOCUS18048 [Linum perenne]
MVTRTSSSQGNHTPSPTNVNSRGLLLLRFLRFSRLRKRSLVEVQSPGNNVFKDVSDKLAKAFCFKCRSTCRVSSSASGSRSPFVVSPPVDVHRKEAIKDCIEFINHSSSLPRSNSVSAA